MEDKFLKVVIVPHPVMWRDRHQHNVIISDDQYDWLARFGKIFFRKIAESGELRDFEVFRIQPDYADFDGNSGTITSIEFRIIYNPFRYYTNPVGDKTVTMSAIWKTDYPWIGYTKGKPIALVNMERIDLKDHTCHEVVKALLRAFSKVMKETSAPLSEQAEHFRKKAELINRIAGQDDEAERLNWLNE